ncbi:transglycosylase [Lactiplantibacillus mudanjiangensis]|uniref:Transglycosylase [Lactobacillus koreensis] n=1 Tax=Lactiplantibacillus mudanjiangensis TaxID=1296538 RepID=A0A660E4M3_9LACO|nr:transglycosylase [Lactiplantibacillus mudanjiangensis]VDG20223.1 transglycosylase [Lactobacillus koreensis] [Lactiplantibacillus mudanjiangensis]VDG24083.1 transglycosylase [Lactobacillus koreensis] [Lactiplantibacillus mudanjiangensis]VDG30262.1 transglycosylase [Lactobacillus koreensis] [Lactiplantibacillus mudanjiangensis]VDG33817.1 transglycosylase [Lactobacillus koreensis] [Lactiplantibacillus mudanjiangensis]
MKNLKVKFAALLLIFSCAFGLVTNVAADLVPSTTVTAQAASLTASQKKQIKAINAGLSKKQKAAKNWIAYRESSYSYTARNGNCYGRYQLLRSYLHGNYSAVNQEKMANKYVAGRYGNWTGAKRFWQSHHWY